MNSKKHPVIGIILGDHAGIGPEITIKALLLKTRDYIPVIIGNMNIFQEVMKTVKGSETLNIELIKQEPLAYTESGCVYFLDIPAGSDIKPGMITADSGQLINDSMTAAVNLERKGLVDGIVLGPITKQAFHKAGLPYESEHQLFDHLYGIKGVKNIVKGPGFYRASVVGHCAFSEILSRLTIDAVVKTTKDLSRVMRMTLPPEECTLAVAALNPHAGEDGLFGDEEARILKPAIDILNSQGEKVTGPFPADTVILKVHSKEVKGIVYLYHDQGNIAMKSNMFGEGVPIFTNLPAKIASPGHGSALDIAGKGIADPANMTATIDAVLDMLGK
jgi:4-hydroxythreonine-4-phosphate dehydrogenase